MRDLYATGAADPARITRAVDDDYLATLADTVTGSLGGKVGVAPRLYIKKLVDVLDRVDLHAEFDPRHDYPFTVNDNELTPVERNARAATPDDIDLDV